MPTDARPERTRCAPRCSPRSPRCCPRSLALIVGRDAGDIDEEAVRAMLERLDLQEAGVSARLESRF